MTERRGGRIAAIAATAGLGALGLVLIVVGGVVALREAGAPPDASAADEPVAPVVESSPSPVPTLEEARASAGITALVDRPWVARTAASSGIPERALAAYAGAAIAVEESFPGCGIGWNTLAAIGLVESDHGSFGGARLGEDGSVLPRIIGIPLDGDGAGRVPDTDGGRLDGDAVWDRAVGPMQFIPETWAHYGRDGDGDGEISVDQIDDAALAAATYLCDVGGDLAVAGNWIRAVNAYNPSLDYNHRVADAANAYARHG